MPNWCDTKVRFTGSKEDVEKAYKAIEAITSIPDSSVPEAGWLGYLNEFIYPDQFDFNDLLNQLNNADKKDHTAIKMKRCDLYSLNDCRGWVEDYCVYEISDGPDKRGLELQIMDAWAPHEYILQCFALRYNLNMSMSWEEPGMCLYGRYDPTGSEDWPDWVFDIRLPKFASMIYCSDDDLKDNDVDWPDQFEDWLTNNKHTVTCENICLLVDEFMKWLEDNDPEFDEYEHWFNVHQFEDRHLDLPAEIPAYKKPEPKDE